MDQNRIKAVPVSILRNRIAFNLIIPVFIIFLLTLGWFAVHKQVGTLTQATIAAYQEAELEIVRVAARSIRMYIEEQVNVHRFNDIERIEQNIFKRFIDPIKLLKTGDAWIDPATEIWRHG